MTTEQVTLHTSGQYILDELVLYSYNGSKINLSPNLLELVIHEDMYFTCLSGQLKIVENVNFIEKIPIIGHEYLSVKFKTPTRQQFIEKTFFVYKVDSKLESNYTNKIYSYTLFFVSDEYQKSQKNKFSRSYTNVKASDIVQSIYEDYLVSERDIKPLTIEETLGTKTITFPYMSPFEAIDYLCNNSISNNNKNCSYAFYETFDGYHFNTMTYPSETSQNFTPKYYHFPAGLSEKDALKDLNVEYSRIENYNILHLNNTIQNVSSGVYSAVLHTTNLTKKSTEFSYHSYRNNYYDVSHIDKYDILPSTADQFSDYSYSDYRKISKSSYAYDGIDDNNREVDILLKRNFQIRHFQNSMVTFLLAGDSDRRVGECIEVNIFSGDPDRNRASIYDAHLSGKYLITKIVHMIQPQQYKMRIEASRDAIATPYPQISKDKDLE